MTVKETKRLIIMRHAKSAWDDTTHSDHERTLNARGRRTAPIVADALVERGWQPNFVLSSDSRRTRETWEHMAERFSSRPRLRFDRSLYLAGLDEVQSAAQTVFDEAHTLLVLGHNPGWEDMASRLTNSYLSLKTADCVLMERTAQSWAEALADETGWAFIEFIPARSLTK